MRPEQAFYKALKPHLPGLPERVENAAGAGTPDFYCIYNGYPYWVECKVAQTKKWDLVKLLKPSQIAWYKRHAGYGGQVFFIVKDEIGIHLFSSLTEKIFLFAKPINWELFHGKIIFRLGLPNVP